MSGMVDVMVPALGEEVSTVTLVAWLVEPGGASVEGEPLFEVETDKAVFEVEAEVSGILVEVLAQSGEVVASGAVVARIRAA
jgi:pyruvate/2-oxoglutarate dehydrogenase complex dihydrolipoamide acyltransferase (E2) component